MVMQRPSPVDLQFLQFADELANRVSGGKGRLNTADPDAVRKLLTHVDAQATEFEAQTGQPKQQTFQSIFDQTVGRAAGAVGRGALGAGRFIAETNPFAGTAQNIPSPAPLLQDPAGRPTELGTALSAADALAQTGGSIGLEGLTRAADPGLRAFGVEGTSFQDFIADLDRRRAAADPRELLTLQQQREAFRESEIPTPVKIGAEIAFDPLNVIPGAALTTRTGQVVRRGAQEAAEAGARRVAEGAGDVARQAGEAIPDGAAVRRAADRVSPFGVADAAEESAEEALEREIAAVRQNLDNLTEPDLRRTAQQLRRTGNETAAESVTPPSQAQLRSEIGDVPREAVPVLQKRVVREGADAYLASEDVRARLKVAIELFAKPIARQAARENLDVFKQRLSEGIRAAQGAVRRGDLQGAARIQQAAQRGARISDTRFEPLARRADPENLSSDVVQLADEPIISNEDIFLLHQQVRSHFFGKGLPQSAVNQQFALNKLLLGERLQPGEIRLLEEALGMPGVIRNRGRDNVSNLVNLLAIPKTLRSAIDMSGYLRQAGFYVINLKNLSPSATGAARRKTVRDSMGIMFRAYKGKDRIAREVWDDISQRNPSLWEAVTQRSGGRRLHLYAPDELALSQRDEAFLSTIFTRMAGLNIRQGSVPLRLAKVPFKLLGEGVERSEVAFTGMLNRIRYDAVEQLVRDAERNGLQIFSDPGPEGFRSVVADEFMDDIVNWTNITTGRGNLGGTIGGRRISAEGFAPLLNGLFWAPRLATARAETLVRGPSRVLREGARIARTGDVAGRRLATPEQLAVRRTAEEFVGFLSAGMTILGLGVAAKEAGVPGFEDFEVELDPRSSDFGKGKFGTTRFDFWGGHQQFVRNLAQMITGQRKTTTTGKVQDNSLAETTFRFARSKLAPGAPTIAVNELSRDTFLGEELSAPSSAFGTERVDEDEQLGFIEQFVNAATPGGGGGSVRTRDVMQQFIPLTTFEYLDVMRERGLIEGSIMAVPPFFGAGSQTFGEQTTAGSTP